MEAIGAGANVLAFITLGLKCAKTIHSTLSIIKDGPRIVQQAATAVSQLHWTLLQAQQSRAVTDDVSLQGQIQRCVEDLDSLAKIVTELQIPPNEKWTGKVWRRFKLVLDEKILDTINGQITQHATILSLRLDFLSSDMIFDLRDRNFQTGRCIEQVDLSLERKHRDQMTRLTRLESNFANSLSNHNRDMKDKLSSLQQVIEERASVSAQETSDLHTILQDIKSHVVSLSSRDSTSTQPIPQTTKGDTISDEDILESIERISCMISIENKTIDAYQEVDEEAASIINDLRTLLTSARRFQESMYETEEDLQTYGTDKLSRKQLDLQLARSSGFLENSQLFINQSLKRKRDELPGTLVHQSGKYRKVHNKVGTWYLMARKKVRSTTERSNVVGSPKSTSRGCIDYETKITFIPQDRQRFHMIIATALQQQHAQYAVSSITRLSVNRVLPRVSPVFSVVEDGNLQRLQEMLNNGEALLRDHDEDGASLLFYALKTPEMCKFLIDSGLDLDHRARGRIIYKNRQNPYTPLELTGMILYPGMENIGIRVKQFEEIRICERMLLEGGADPTITNGPVTNGYFGRVVTTAPIDIIYALWDSEFVRYSADIHGVTGNDFDNKSLFLLRCRNLPYNDEEALNLLLDLGAGIHDRDSDGKTCLHIYMKHIRHDGYGEDAMGYFSSLQTLVKRGADVLATDHHGETVSDIAYNQDDNKSRSTGSFSGDLWDSVLQSCGFDIAQFRAGRERIPFYTKYYTESDFRNLWKGRESYCPYYYS
ncbi:hypothetical protein F4810DRAFT_697255 [Camillea tinctor]|nr:hypothetical protein F4810DRAFT_697255 [Camillea tinctor]